MAADSDGKDLFDLDLPEELDDDLGGDWESAFQAEDFMLSPDEEPDEFFIKEGEADEDIDDLASLLESDDTHPKKGETTLSKTAGKELSQEEEKKDYGLLSFLPLPLISIFTSCYSWFTSRTLFQKILIPAGALLLVLTVCAVLFFRSTSEQLAEQPSPDAQPASATPETKESEKNLAAIPPAPTEEVSPEPPVQNRKKWPMPAFLIAVQEEESEESVVVRVDLSLVLLLPPGQTVPEQKRSFVRDAIYQFYSNRPVKELRHYSLARGEMIRNLEAWLHKEWPQNPIANIIFNRYQVIK